MRKRSIEELAKALAYTRPERPVQLTGLPPSAQDRARELYQTAYNQWSRDVRAAARAAAERNETFSYPRFYAMCGLNEVQNGTQNG